MTTYIHEYVQYLLVLTLLLNIMEKPPFVRTVLLNMKA